MPFIVPAKRQTLSKNSRFSKYKNLQESTYLLLQGRKGAGDKSKHPRAFRIITKGVYPWYEIAYNNSYDDIKSKEWNYVTNELPSLMPKVCV